MGLRDLFTDSANLLRHPDFGFGEEITLYDTSAGADSGTPFDGILEIITADPLQRFAEEEAVYEEATIDCPISLTITKTSWFLARGKRWNFSGRGGRDRDMQTINVRSAEPIAKKTANRR